MLQLKMCGPLAKNLACGQPARTAPNDCFMTGLAPSIFATQVGNPPAWMEVCSFGAHMGLTLFLPLITSGCTTSSRHDRGLIPISQLALRLLLT